MDIQIRKGGLEDLDSFLTLIRETKAAMEQQDWFFLDPEEEIRDLMERRAMELWVAMDSGRMAGAFSLIHPGLEPFNYGFDLGFPEAMLRRVVHMDTVAVHPHYRGRGLMGRLMEVMEGELAKVPGRILICTIHPDNVYSLNNVRRRGYSVAGEKAKYGSVRLFLRKDLP